MEMNELETGDNNIAPKQSKLSTDRIVVEVKSYKDDFYERGKKGLRLVRRARLAYLSVNGKKLCIDTPIFRLLDETDEEYEARQEAVEYSISKRRATREAKARDAKKQQEANNSYSIEPLLKYLSELVAKERQSNKD